MNKELQDLVWAILPKEFKEEVKRIYENTEWKRKFFLRDIFGTFNLTSDAEGEEMLMCDRNTVRMLYDRTDSVKVRQTLESLFGPKCLRDEPASEVASEPKSETNKHFDNILKDSFRNERRLNIAAMAMQGILSNPQLLKIAIETYQEEIGSPNIYVAVAKAAKEQVDALIAECELTEKLKGE